MKNLEIFNESKQYMPGGVNSPVRAFKDLTITPPVIKKGKGVIINDEDENKYIDFVCAWGPMILGHSDEDVVKAIKNMCRCNCLWCTYRIRIKISKAYLHYFR